jgi:NitT/TauT family transport system permease protein
LQAVAPILLILLGSGFSTKTTIAFLIAFFPIYSACLTALFTTPKNLMNLLFVCRSPLLRGIWHVRLPSALPAIISSAKVGFTLAVLGAVVAEFIHPDEGLGYLLLIAQSSYNIEVIYICIGLLMFQGVIIYQGLSFFESYIMRTRGE